MAAMTVQKLRELLDEFEDDTIIILSSDGEGNSMSPVPEEGGYSYGTYYPDNTWSGDFIDANWGPEDYDAEDYEDEEGQEALVLWPTN